MNSSNSPERVVSIRESAQRAHTTTHNVKRLIKSGLLHGVLLPGHKRMSGVTEASLNALISNSVVKEG